MEKDTNRNQNNMADESDKVGQSGDKKPDNNQKEQTSNSKAKIEVKSEPSGEADRTQSGWKLFTLPVLLLIILGLRFIFDANRFFSDIKQIISIVSFMLWGFGLAFLLDPFVDFFENKVYGRLKKGARALSMLTVYILFFGIFTVLMIFIIPTVAKNITETTMKIPDAIRTITRWWEAQVQAISDNEFLNEYLIAYGERINEGITDFFRSDQWNDFLNRIGTGIVTTAWGATQAVLNFIVGLVLSIYMLSDKKNMMLGIKRFTYAAFTNQTADRLVQYTKKSCEIFRKFILGKGVISLFVGIIAFIFTSIMDMPVPPLQGTILFLTNMIPTIGPFIGAVPCLLITVLDNPINALWLLIFIVAIQQVDGMYLGPKILGDSMGLKPFYVIVGVLIGGSIAGLFGAFLGAPTLAVIGYFITKFVQRKLKEKQITL